MSTDIREQLLDHEILMQRQVLAAAQARLDALCEPIMPAIQSVRAARERLVALQACKHGEAVTA